MNKFESAEDYLECILILSKKNSYVRAIDVANELEFTKASVSIALKKLREKQYISVNESTGAISLTEQGYRIASLVLERHEVLSELFVKLGVDKNVALQDACKIEHDLSDETFIALKNLNNKME